jgi:hypothetical protein
MTQKLGRAGLLKPDWLKRRTQMQPARSKVRLFSGGAKSGKQRVAAHLGHKDLPAPPPMLRV